MKRQKNQAKALQPQRPMLVTGVVAASVVLLFLVAPRVARWLDPTRGINITQSSHETTGGVQKGMRTEDAPYAGFDGEVARTERRLRGSGANGEVCR